MLPMTPSLSLSSFLFLTIASHSCPDYCCHGSRGAGPPLGDLETTSSKDPYVIGALLWGVCLCVLVYACVWNSVYCCVLQRTDILCTIIKQGSHGAVGSHTLTTGRGGQIQFRGNIESQTYTHI